VTDLYQDATGELKARSLVDASMIAGEAIVHDAAAVDLEHAENRFQSGQYIVLDMAAQARRDQRVRVRLVEAGEALLTALNAVATDRELWQHEQPRTRWARANHQKRKPQPALWRASV
jgi:hypothetical protein